jgi:p-aminobenzoyl-glutamate transporter AbgT
MWRLVILGAVTASILLSTAGASPAAQSPAIADCTSHGRLTRTYSVAQLHAALANMPADVQEYTNCYQVIQSALVAQVSGTHHHTNGSSSSSGGSFLPTPVIVVLAVIVAAGATLGAVAFRRRGQPAEESS